MRNINQIAILITCYNRQEKTFACFDALYKSKVPDGFEYTVFIVDDGSTDGTSDTITMHFPDVHIIKGTGNLFWNRGMQLAWKTAAQASNYDYYLWLNDDTFLFENSLECLLSATKTTNEKSIIVGATCSTENGILTYSGFNKEDKLIEPNGYLQECVNFQGNCVLVPKLVFQKIGTLDKLFHHAIGDLDYGLRAQKAGFKSYVLGTYIGNCESHNTLPIWCLKEVPFLKRLKALYSPLGNSHPYYFFRYELRHYGLLIATKHLFSIHIRVLIPQLWKNRIQLFSK